MARRRSSTSTRGYFGLFAMIAVILIGIALLVALFWKSGASVMKDVGFVIATVLVIVASFNRALAEWRGGGKGGVVWFVLWVIAVIMIVFCFIFPYFR